MPNLNIEPPSLGPQQPLYPHLLQLLRVTTTIVSGPVGAPTLYAAFVEQVQTGTLLLRDRESCLAEDVNGDGILPGYYLARLVNQYTSLPVYAVIGSPIIYTFIGVTFTYTNSTINFNNTIVNITNNSEFIFGFTTVVNTPPPGLLSKPTQTVAGKPTWTPPVGTYPLLWGSYDHIDWEWDGSLWIPFVSVGRTPIADTNYTAISTDRIISYTSITAARTITLPLAAALPAGFILRVLDESGSASATKTISAQRAGSDTVNNGSGSIVIVNNSFGGGTAETDGVSNWTVRLYASTSSSAIYGEHNTASKVGPEPIINFIDKVPTTWTVVDNPGNTSIDVTATVTNFLKVTVYNTNGTYTWTPQTNTVTIVVEVLGAGGGGGGANNGTILAQSVAGVGGGGGAGGYSRSTMANPGATTVTVGAGGSGGTGFANGSNGTGSAFANGSSPTAGGGFGALSDQIVIGFVKGGNGGTAGAGDVAGGGADGLPGIVLTASLNPIPAPGSSEGGAGASTLYGGGGHGGGRNYSSNDGSTGHGPGAGGGGACSPFGSSSQNGGPGVDGQVVVWEYSF